MPDAILVFTFGPVQSYIAEARRASDLYVGSQTLVQLAQAAAQAIGQDYLIYPAESGDDVPNKIVARVQWDRTKAIAQAAENALQQRWQQISETARQELNRLKEPDLDKRWNAIWEAQTARQWEIYWAAAALEGNLYQLSETENSPATLYQKAYQAAQDALDATKRVRTFEAADEPGLKDTLSGRRAALRTADQDAKDYWTQVGQHPQITAAKLRPDGRERLDAIGAIKRFSDLAAQSPFPSVSTVASADFLVRAKTATEPISKEQNSLEIYKHALGALLGKNLHRVSSDPKWPYDGDLLYLEGVTPNRLLESYGFANPDPVMLKYAQDRLRDLYKQVGSRPSPYYAIIVLDGDSMGERVSQCLTQPDPETAHRQLSKQLAEFSKQVAGIVEALYGRCIYNGGDDVLALAPLSTALQAAQELATRFNKETSGTASAGIAIVHHFYPLGAALRAARQAERQAKLVSGKAAVCVRVLRRSGEITEMRSPWAAMTNTMTQMIELFKGDQQGQPLAARLAYDVNRSTYALNEADAKFEAELKRLINRHRNVKHAQAPNPKDWAAHLRVWASHLPNRAEELGYWLAFARFVAQGGGE